MVIGLRCSNKDYSFAILDGSKKKPILIKSDTISFPTGFSRPNSLKWFYQELDEISKKYNLDCWVLKGTEYMIHKGPSYTVRIENEAMVLLIAANKGDQNVVRKLKAKIAKDLGCKGRAKYLNTDIDLNYVQGYIKSSEKINEAILVAWSSL